MKWNPLGAGAVIRALVQVVDPHAKASKSTAGGAPAADPGGQRADRRTGGGGASTRLNPLGKFREHADFIRAKFNHQVAKQSRPSRQPADPRPKAMPSPLSSEGEARFLDARRGSRARELNALGAGKEGMHDGETALAAYLAARSTLHRTIDGDELQGLRRAHESVTDARRMLRHGRGNVSLDLEKSHEAFWRTAFSRKKLDNAADLRKTTAMALRMGAGNCGEHADVAFVVHAAKLQGAETVSLMAGTVPLDHSWAESQLPRGGGRIVIDPWAVGPAVLAEDSAFSDALARPKALATLGQADGQALARDVATRFEALTADKQLAREWKDFRKDAQDKNLMLAKARVWPPASVVHRDFKYAVRRQEQLAADLRSDVLAAQPAAAQLGQLHRAITAAGAARALGETVRGAVRAQPGITQEFEKLLPKPTSTQTPTRSR